MQQQQAQNSKKKGPVRSGYVANSNPVFIQVTTNKNEETASEFTHDESSVTRLALTFREEAKVHDLRNSHEPLDDEVIDDCAYRVVSMGVAKKLANSMPPNESSVYGGMVKEVKRVDVKLTAGLVPAVDTFGTVEGEQGNFYMVGQATWCFTYFMRALAGDVIPYSDVDQIIEQGDFFINTDMRKASIENFRVAMIGIVNAWVTNVQPNVVLTFGEGAGQIRTTFKAPLFLSGAQAYSQMIAQVAGKPIKVVRALDCIALCEGVVANNYVINQATVQAFNAQKVKFASGGADYVSDRMEWYQQNIVRRLQVGLGANANWVDLTSFRRFGSYGQLVRRDGSHRYVCPVEVTGIDAQFGVLMSGDEVWINRPTNLFQLSASKARNAALDDFVASGFKS